MRRLWLLLIVSLVVALAPIAHAHDGPPYPILVDQVTGPFRMSAWADPDVGVGTFFIYLESAGASRLPDDCRVTIFVQPANRLIPEVGYRAEPQKVHKGPSRFFAKVPFDTRENWRVRFQLASAAGNGSAETEVAVTPPGQGPILDFVLYLFPFAAVGFLFVKAALKRRDPKRLAKP